MTEGLTDPRALSTAIVLINGYDEKMPLKDLCLYTWIRAALTFGQKRFFVQWRIVNANMCQSSKNKWYWVCSQSSEGVKEDKSHRIWKNVVKHSLQYITWTLLSWTHRSCDRPHKSAHDQFCQNSNTDWRGAHETLPLAEELLMINDFWWRGSYFVSRFWSSHNPTNIPMPMNTQATQVEPSVLHF